jgi:nicotinate-nucleotide adenylyltransferase
MEHRMRSRRARIGILGGSFDPIHVGHLVIAESARDQLRLDRVLFVPAASPPHKPHRTLAPAADRVAMARAAVRGNPAFEVSTIEIRRGGTSYTLDTLLELGAQLPRGTEMHFLVGADSALEIDTWHEVRRVLDLAHFVILPRPGFRLDALERLANRIGPRRVAALRRSLLDSPILEISSSDIRRRVASGLSIRYLVPEVVRRHIERQGLYRDER